MEILILAMEHHHVYQDFPSLGHGFQLPGPPGHVPRFLPLEIPRLLFTHGYQCEAPGEWDPETPLFIEGGTILIAALNNHWRISVRKKPVISN